jgi:SAM-dependent methyltransferase
MCGTSCERAPRPGRGPEPPSWHPGPGGWCTRPVTSTVSGDGPDALFADPRLAPLYDHVDADRSDLEVYVALVDELGARRVIDIGCGTGTFACLLAARGLEVVAVDPAAASLDVARRKPNAGAVRWVHADATGVPAVGADLATMTGNVAQVFLGDDDLLAALRTVRGRCDRVGGSSSRCETRRGGPGSTGTARPPTRSCTARSSVWSGRGRS